VKCAWNLLRACPAGRRGRIGPATSRKETENLPGLPPMRLRVFIWQGVPTGREHSDWRVGPAAAHDKLALLAAAFAATSTGVSPHHSGIVRARTRLAQISQHVRPPSISPTAISGVAGRGRCRRSPSSRQLPGQAGTQPGMTNKTKPA